MIMLIKPTFFLHFTSPRLTSPRFTSPHLQVQSSPVHSTKYSMPSITTSIKQALIDAHFVPQGMFPDIVCKKKQ